jgi:dTDP-4-dehydrorhamnose reductase
LRKINSGIYHASPKGQTSWHGLASLVAQLAIDSGMSLKANVAAIKAIPTSAYPTAAPRPMNSCLSTKKLEFELKRLGLVSKLPHWNAPWDEQVNSYVRQLVAG